MKNKLLFRRRCLQKTVFYPLTQNTISFLLFQYRLAQKQEKKLFYRMLFLYSVEARHALKISIISQMLSLNFFFATAPSIVDILKSDFFASIKNCLSLGLLIYKLQVSPTQRFFISWFTFVPNYLLITF